MATSDLDAKLISQGTQVTSVDGAALVPVATAEGQPQKNITLEGLADSMGAQAAESVNITSLWGQTEEGKMVRITNQSAANIIGTLLYGATNKNDLATVVAGVLGAFRSGESIELSSAGEINYNSVHLIRGIGNLAGLNDYGLLLTFKLSYIRVQLFFPANSGNRNLVYYRHYLNSWFEWHKFTTSTV